MKKGNFGLILVMTIILAMSFALTGCGSSNDEDAVTDDTQQEEAASDGAIQGEVVDATMDTVTIKVSNGSEFIFITEDADVSSPKGLLVGDTVTIHYTGEFNDQTEKQDVTVTEIFVDAEATPMAAPANPPVDFISGKIIDASMNTLQIRTESGKVYMFATEDVTAEGSLVNGETVAVHFDGTLDDTADVQPVQVTSIKVTGGTKASSKPAAEKVHALRGTVDQVEPGQIMMSDATGVDYLFDIANAVAHVGSAGIQPGDNIIIYYTGTLASSPDMQQVKVSEVVAAY